MNVNIDYVGNVMSSNTAVADAKPAPVESELQHVNDRLSALVRLVDTLSARLAPVLRPEDGVLARAADQLDDRPVMSPLAASLRSTADALDFEAGRLEQLVRRLEV